MKTLKFKGILLNDGWKSDCFVELDNVGKLLSISENGTADEDINGYAIPGFQNAHSHAFQYAMCGLAEIHPDPSKQDDFWSWRETMYNIALSINPDQLEAVATMLYAEMLRHGYTSVAEFHYLHHDKDGRHFDNQSEMGERLVAAAANTGINITLAPMFYQKGGFGKDAEPKQRRFISKSVDEYAKLLDASEKTVSKYENASLGMGIHSLRAVAPNDVVASLNNLSKSKPIHIHISEQLKEVEDCLAFHNQRPVEWLLSHADVSTQYHLVHATHLSQKEIKGITKSGAHVVICPSTEGNLGDGIFPLKTFQGMGGNWSIGTDSHIGLSPLEELRMLDYGQRLTTHRRNQFVSPTDGNAGHFGFDMALISGRKAMGNHNESYFKVGEKFDAVIINDNTALIATSKSHQILSTLVYSGDSSFLLGTIIGGNWKTKSGHHIREREITSKFLNAMKSLNIR